MSDCVTQINSNESVETSLVRRQPMDSLQQQSHQTQQTSQTIPQTTQQSPQTTQLLIGQQVSPIVTPIEVSQTNANQMSEQSVHSCTSANSGVNVSNVSMSSNIITSNASEPQNALSSANISSVSSSSLPSVVASSGVSIPTQSTQSHQLIASSSQPQMVSTSQSTHLNASNALLGQSMTTITTVSNPQTVQMSAHQSPHHNSIQPLLQTSVQPSLQSQANHMSVAMSQLPQVQVIQQPIGATTGTYQFQQVYPQQMLLPGNLTIQNMPFGAPNQGLSLQIPFTATHGVSTHTMPISSIAAKPPIMSKGVAISPLTQSIASQHNIISPLKPNIGHQSTQQILKQVLPAQQFVPHSATNQTVVISQLLPHQNQHSMQQSILPATNRTILETPKGKPFMLSHSGTIQPKSPILPATSISSSLIANSHFKSPFSANTNTTQLIATQTPSSLLTNSPQILGSFQTLPQGLTWTTAPQSAHLVAQNGSPFFIRTPTQSGEHMYIQTSSPQIQTVSMGTPISVHSSATTMQVNAAQTQSTPLAPTQITASLHAIPTVSHVNTSTTTTVVNTSQPTAIAPAPIASGANKARTSRQTSSAATQTNTSAIGQKQHMECSTSTPLKPIAPAKPKPNSQSVAQISKPVNKDQTTSTPIVRPTGVVATTQTISQQTIHPNKSDASNQTTKVSVGTETSKTNQISSSRVNSTEQNKPNTKSNSSTGTNTTTELSQSKVNSVTEEVKAPNKKPPVEKKDASTGQDSDLIGNFFAQQQQHNHQSVQNTIQTTHSSNTMSQTNGQQIPVLADLNRQDISKQPPQKAIVKPQILTHVIDGYIIQESPNPFPVNGLSYSSDQNCLSDDKTNGIISENIKSKTKNENSNANPSSSRNRTASERHLCLNCGTKRKSSSKNNRIPKRFCSHSCSEKFNLNNDKNCVNNSRLTLYNSVTSNIDNNEIQRQDLSIELTTNESEKQTLEERKKLKSLKRSHESVNDFNSTKNGEINVVNERNQRKPNTSDVVTDRNTPLVTSISQIVNSTEEPPNSSAIAGLYIPPGGRNPLQWSVNDVYEFVRNLQGCTEYADEFRSQEIDGQALMLIKEDHLMNTMNMKLGPALKICSKINALREDVQKQT